MRGAIVIVVLLAAACEREERTFDVPRDRARPAEGPAGGKLTEQHPGLESFPATEEVKPPGYVESAWAIAEGKVLFEAYNCSGCHSHGGGGMGPPLMDGKWIYGWRPEDIYDTVVLGRPNGMPSFRGKIAGSELWKIVAYVRSLAPLVAHDRPTRP